MSVHQPALALSDRELLLLLLPLTFNASTSGLQSLGRPLQSTVARRFDVMALPIACRLIAQRTLVFKTADMN